MFTLDTNILIYYAAGEAAIDAFLHENSDAIFYLPTMTVVEFLSYPSIEIEVVDKFKLFLTQTTPINLDINLAEQAAEICRLYRLKTADAIIAATALFTHSSLVTRNVRDLKKILD